MFQVIVYSLCRSGTAELRHINPVSEGGIAGIEAKALVWKWNCGTSNRIIFLMWKRNYWTFKHYSLCGSGMSDLKVQMNKINISVSSLQL